MTNVLNFPGLGLSFELNRVAFTVFGHNVYWYGVIIAFGFILAVGYCHLAAWRFGIDKEIILDFLLLAAPLSILGARAYYVIFYLDLFRNPDGSINWGETIAIWDGGLAIYGAIIVAVTCVIVFSKRHGIKTFAMLDLGCYGLLIGQSIGRWGNFVNIEAFGGITDLPWRMSAERIANMLWNGGQLESMDTYEAVLSGELGVHPTFLYESVWNAIGFGLLILMARKIRKVDGQIFLSYVIWYGVGRAFIEGLRTDSLYFFGTGIRTSQMLGIVSALVAAIWLVWRLKYAGPASAPFTAGDTMAEGEEPAGRSASVKVVKGEEEEENEHGGDQT